MYHHVTPTPSFEGVCVNCRHPGPRRVWKGAPSCTSCHHFTGSRGIRGRVPKSSNLLLFTILERMWPSPNQPRSRAACSPGGTPGASGRSGGADFRLNFRDLDPGGLFWPQKNLGRAILAAEKLGWALFGLRKNHAHAYILEI